MTPTGSPAAPDRLCGSSPRVIRQRYGGLCAKGSLRRIGDGTAAVLREHAARRPPTVTLSCSRIRQLTEEQVTLPDQAHLSRFGGESPVRRQSKPGARDAG